MDNKIRLDHEWQTLQNNHEQYEQSALLIKLASLVLCVGGLAANVSLFWLGIAVLLCWGQEGIYKTYQTRLVERLLDIEAALRQDAPTLAAMQLYSAWASGRPKASGLIATYAASALRPTVAFPYLPIILAGSLAQRLHWV